MKAGAAVRFDFEDWTGEGRVSAALRCGIVFSLPPPHLWFGLVRLALILVGAEKAHVRGLARHGGRGVA